MKTKIIFTFYFKNEIIVKKTHVQIDVHNREYVILGA